MLVQENRDAVRARLEPLGFEVVDSHYADAYGLRITRNAIASTDQEAVLNLNLGADAMTMLTILWCKLALPSRVVGDSGRATGQNRLTPEGQRQARAEAAPRVHVESLITEFADKFPKREHVLALLGRLRNMGFVNVRSQYVFAAPMLEIAIDGERMKEFVETSLAELRARADAMKSRVEDTVEERVYAWLRGKTDPVRRTDIQDGLGLPEDAVSTALKILREDGRVKMVGSGWKARYLAVVVELAADPAEVV